MRNTLEKNIRRTNEMARYRNYEILDFSLKIQSSRISQKYKRDAASKRHSILRAN